MELAELAMELAELAMEPANLRTCEPANWQWNLRTGGGTGIRTCELGPRMFGGTGIGTAGASPSDGVLEQIEFLPAVVSGS